MSLRSSVKFGVTGVALRGAVVACPCCEGEFRRFLHADGVANVRCPRCGSYPRHRVLWLWLAANTGVESQPLRVLHIAPEAGIARRLRGRDNVEYLSGDIDPSRAERQLDVSDLPFEDGSWDLVICNHVLTYVADDRRAFAELHRVLAPGGMLVMQNPVNDGAAEKYETSRYGLRIYGRDLPGLVRGAGFDLQVRRFRDEFDEADLDRFGLRPASRHGAGGNEVRADDVYAATKPAGVPTTSGA